MAAKIQMAGEDHSARSMVKTAAAPKMTREVAMVIIEPLTESVWCNPRLTSNAPTAK